MNWGLVASSLAKSLKKGFVRVTPGNPAQPYTIAYLTGPNQKLVANGEYLVEGERGDGSKIVVMPDGKEERPTTAWRESAHEAGVYGTSLLGNLVPGRLFPYAKSLYAVEDCLRVAVGTKPDALVLDFFGGSGTTAHAIARLNRQDGGRRQTILVTNNEVSEVEAKTLRKKGFQEGDPQWESKGIFEYITRPRIEAAVTGLTPAGESVEGEYKFVDEFKMSEGLDERFEFFELTYLDADAIELNRAFAGIAPLLWMRAGSIGPVLEETHRSDGRRKPYAMSPQYGVLFNPDCWRSFLDKLESTVKTIFVVTDSPSVFQGVVSELPNEIEPIRLYENYLSTFTINTRSAP